MLPSAPLTFDMLQQRLIAAVRLRIRNGEFTERGLARLIDVSQPHLHNVLKGCKTLTPEIGDALLHGLSLSLLEILSSDELGQTLLDRQPAAAGRRHLPLLHGQLGPEAPFPDWRSVSEWLRLSSARLNRIRHAALVEYAPDPENLEFPAPAFALLDQDETARLRVSPRAWYAIRWRGAGYLRRLRREPGALIILGQNSSIASGLPTHLELADASLLHVVRARLLWLGPDPRTLDPFSQSGVRFADFPADS